MQNQSTEEQMSATAANTPIIGQATPASSLPQQAHAAGGATAATRLLGGISFADLAAISLSRSAGTGLAFNGNPLAERQSVANRDAAPPDRLPPIGADDAPPRETPNASEERNEAEEATSVASATGPVFSTTPEIVSEGRGRGQNPGSGQGQADLEASRPAQLQTPSTASNAPTERAAATDRPLPGDRPTQSPPTALKAQITDAPQEQQPKPNVPLHARTAIAAQAASEKSTAAAPDTAGGNRPSPNTLIGAHTLARHAHGPSAANGAQSRGRAAGQTSVQAAQFNATPQAQATVEAAAKRNALLSTLGRSAQTSPRQISPVLPDVSAATGNGLGGSQASQRAVDISPAFKPRPAMPPRFVTNQVSVQIQKAVAQGTDRITIQLKPAELGRVDVRLDVAMDGRVAATITTDRPDTLELLQRDARTLLNSLHDSGLRTDSDSLNFQLRSHSNAMDRGQDGESTDADAENDATTDMPNETASRPDHIGHDRVDIEV